MRGADKLDGLGDDEDEWLARFSAIVGRYLRSEGGMSPIAAAAEFTEPVDHAFLARGAAEAHIEDILWPAWQAVVSAADTPHDQARARLVELLSEIRSRGVLMRPGGQECVVWGMRAHVDLPVFRAQIRHTWNFPPPAVSVESWANLNGFTAQLTAAGIDFSLYAIWAIRDALEEDDLEVSRVLPAAVQWFRHAGSALASLTLQRAADEYGRDRAGKLCQEAGLVDRGFSNQRWDFWRRRLEDIAATGGDVAEKARQGLQYMPAPGATTRSTSWTAPTRVEAEGPSDPCSS